VQHADAAAAGRGAEAAGAADLARLMEARERALEPQAGEYDGWSAETAQVRDDAAKARAELARRGREPEVQPPGGGPGSGPGCGGPEGRPGPEAGPDEAAWWAQFETTREAIEALLAREREKAATARRPRAPHPRAGADRG
jgi:hypothetical protein